MSNMLSRAKGEVFQGIDDLDRMIYGIIEILKNQYGEWNLLKSQPLFSKKLEILSFKILLLYNPLIFIYLINERNLY